MTKVGFLATTIPTNKVTTNIRGILTNTTITNGIISNMKTSIDEIPVDSTMKILMKHTTNSGNNT